MNSSSRSSGNIEAGREDAPPKRQYRSSKLAVYRTELVKAASIFAHYLTRLEYRQTGRDPKNNGFAFAAVPEWQMRQALDSIRRVTGDGDAKLSSTLDPNAVPGMNQDSISQGDSK